MGQERRMRESKFSNGPPLMYVSGLETVVWAQAHVISSHHLGLFFSQVGPLQQESSRVESCVRIKNFVQSILCPLMALHTKLVDPHCLVLGLSRSWAPPALGWFLL